MLPSKPKIFHGRDTELADIVGQFTLAAPRIAILGPAGIGKTSLAKAALHNPDLVLKYEDNRIFVGCDSASTKEELVTLPGVHLRLNPGKHLQRQVIHHLNLQPCLLILDNLETTWEPSSSRRETEAFLSLLADIQSLAMIITMRGAERPANIPWNHPFLHPLMPLNQEAARRTFIDIAEDIHESSDVDRILLLTNNMPLVITLMAHLADAEDCPTVLSRWEEEKTGLLSQVYDKKSNLDLSISLSLSRPRVTSLTSAMELLNLLSILPDGLSDAELIHYKFPLENILSCKAALLCTSLAYLSGQKVKVLLPIREYVQKYHSAKFEMIEPLFWHYKDLLQLFKDNLGTIIRKNQNCPIDPHRRHRCHRQWASMIARWEGGG
ncbi:hypothetical protein B0H16DRAFT_1314908 [Mycena metata]|uniref:Novel STAND NTPase 1 domain-containing protein n=1 Tax=Mycena metata TaxID=1033252 RepID=A0AAD7NCV8_9AGAR|nr:hypothetical protein B0H16DRAFT_1314908 [Mycena metata]